MKKQVIRKPRIKDPEITYATNLDIQRLEARFDAVDRRFDVVDRRFDDQRKELRIYFAILGIIVTLYKFLE